MKKIFIFVLVFFSFWVTINAECEYKDIRELNNLASYVQSNYQYNESTNNFDVTVTNLTDKFYIRYGSKKYEPSSGTVIISDLPEGTRISAEVVVSTTSDCFNEIPRMLFINIPYINPYYKSNLCSGHESLNVCNSRFLDYKISESTFIKLLDQDNENKKNNGKEDDNDNDNIHAEKPTFIDKTIDVVKSYTLPIILVIVSSGITISIYSVIIRKIKHKL